jgi:undecaprenyl-diphosphatase
MNALVELDHSVFLAINQLQGSALFDPILLYGTELGTFVGTALVIVAYLMHAPRPIPWRKVSMIGALVVIVGLSSTWLKFLVHRERPPLVVHDAHVLGPLLTLYSFPSGHSVTAFSLLAFLLVVDRPLGFLWLPIACFVAFSRLYLGVHFPSDVLFGAAFGFFGVYPLAKRVWSAA